MVEVGKVAAILHEGGKDLPAETVAEGETAVEVVLILAKEAVLGGGATDVGAGDGKVQRGGLAEEEIAECVAGKGALESEVTEVVGVELGSKSLQVEIPNAADIDAALQGMLAAGKGRLSEN